MQIEISFEPDDLADLYDNLGATTAADEAAVDEGDRAGWLQANHLEPLVDAYLLGEIAKAKQNKAYDTAMIEAKADQDALASKVEEAQASRQAAAKAAPAAVKDEPASPVKGASVGKN